MEKIKIVIAGDFAPQNRIQEKIDSNQYQDILSDVKPILESVDYSIVNFESSIPSENAKKISKVGPYLKTTLGSLKLLNYVGFNCLALANNHIRDYGDVGIKNIIDNCSNYQLDSVGAGINRTESQRVLYKQIKTTVIAFINICEEEFSIATDTQYGAAPMDIIDNYHQIDEARKKADYIIMIIHGGTEYLQLPSPRMVKTYRFFIDMGVDTVINHHQHCYGGFEIYKNKPIFYGLGNFCFDYPDRFDSVWNEGYMVELILSSGKITYKLHPYKQCNKNARVTILNDSSKFKSRIYEINTIISNDHILQQHTDKILKNKGKTIVDSLLQPYNNRILKALHSRGYLPSFTINKQSKLILSHYVSCASHRDKLLTYLRTIE